MVLCLALVAGRGVSAQQLSLWHDLGDNGTKWFTEAMTEFAKTHPGVSIRPVSYPTDQWFGRVIGAINTDTAPDLIYNNYERVIRIATQTGKVMDLKSALAGVADHSFLSEDDLRVATYRGTMIILPIQRVQMAFGARKSWLDKVGEKFPVTWDDTKRTARKFQDDDPDGDGKPDTFGFAMQASNARNLIHMLDLFTFGSGLRHTVIDPDGNIVIDEPRHAQVLEAFLRIFAVDKLVPPDTVNYSFNEMYQVIEGGKTGFFRVGDWNVNKWTNQAINGDFVVGPWPKFFPDLQNAVVIGGMRGVAVPENSPNKKLAVEFAQFLLSKPAQQLSLNLVGSAVRTDLDTSALVPEAKRFAHPEWKLVAYDFPESIHPWYPQLEEAYYRKLMAAIASPPADWQAFIKQTADEMRATAKTLAAKQ
jgi:ABC-type glycerol-3-phosphate transport system substrate-binding protein